MSKNGTRWFGAHVSSAGGFVNAAKNGAELGATAVQIHPSPPQRWNTNPYPDGYEDEFLKALESSGIQKVFFHGVYLINLASPDDKLRANSIRSLVHYLQLMEKIRGEGVIFHIGSLKDEPSEQVGYERAAECVNRIFDTAPGSARLLLEISAGGGKIIGDKLEELAEVYQLIDAKDRVGFALDTQHLWASGYDLRNGLEAFMNEAEKILTFKKIWAVHINDSMTALGSRRDRHANIGEGEIGEEALRAFVNHEKLRKIPLILETPALKSMDTAKAEVEKLRQLLGVGN